MFLFCKDKTFFNRAYPCTSRIKVKVEEYKLFLFRPVDYQLFVILLAQ